MYGELNGDFLDYRVDWSKSQMTLRGASPWLQLEEYAIPITPWVRALDKFVRLNGEARPVQMLVDLEYSSDSLKLCLHRTNDFQSVVNVPRALLAQLFGGLLTPRELEVAVELFEGHTIRYIAGHLHIAEGTVKRMNYNVYQKLNVASQVELIREIYARLAERAAQNQRLP